jgi:hypothetical protein
LLVAPRMLGRKGRGKAEGEEDPRRKGING